MRRWMCMAVAAAGLGACADAPVVAPDTVLVDIRIDQRTPDGMAAEGRARVGMHVAVPAPAAGCHRVSEALSSLPEGAAVSVHLGGDVPLAVRGGVAVGRFGVLDRDLAWTPVSLEGTAAGGWLVAERSAAQVPSAPRLRAVIVEPDGSITAHRDARAPDVVLEVDTEAGTWRCDAEGEAVTAPWWLARGDATRVYAVRDRIERHRTSDGVPVVGRVRVRVPAQAAELLHAQGPRAPIGGERG